MLSLCPPLRSSLVQHLLKADGGTLLVVAVPLEQHDDAADELPDGDGRQSAVASRDAASDGGDEHGSRAQSGPGRVTELVGKLDLSRLHGRGTVARVRQLTRLAEVHCLLPSVQISQSMPASHGAVRTRRNLPLQVHVHIADATSGVFAAEWRVGAGARRHLPGRRQPTCCAERPRAC